MAKQQRDQIRSNIEWIIYYNLGYAIVAIIMAAPTMIFYRLLHESATLVPAYGFWDSFWIFFVVLSVRNILFRRDHRPL